LEEGGEGEGLVLLTKLDDLDLVLDALEILSDNIAPPVALKDLGGVDATQLPELSSCEETANH